MPDVKAWFRSLQPLQLYVILVLTIIFFLAELTVSHLTHALTLLMDSYHMMCNIMALTGCIITIKYGTATNKDNCPSPSSEKSEEMTLNPSGCNDKQIAPSSPARASQERKLKNTFGWARIDVMSMLCCCVFLASMCFSLVVEAIQTLIHIDHQDEMHHPGFVIWIGVAGLLMNFMCYLLIGGYTFHQGSFLYVTEGGDVVLDKVVVSDNVNLGQRRLSRTRSTAPLPRPKERQGCKEMLRDIAGCLFVIVCSLLVMFTDIEIAKYIDPAISILSAALLVHLSYPYMKESCLILLQTIPDTMSIDALRKDLLERFPDIVNVHDFHIWQLTASKVISTVHIIFQNPKVYRTIMNDVKEFFLQNGITQVTIQPEFYKASALENLSSKKYAAPLCLMQCLEEGCKSSHCCPDISQSPLLDKLKSASKETIPSGNQTPDLKSVKVFNEELHSLSNVSCVSSENNTNSTEPCDKVGDKR